MKYYKTDSRKISFTEYWHIAVTLKGFLRASFNKIRGKQMNLPKGIGGFRPFRERLIGAANIPPKVLADLEEGMAQFWPLGFNDHWYYSSNDSLREGVGYSAQMLHSSGKTMAKIIFVAVRDRRNFSFSLVSKLKDDRFYFTTNNKRRFNNAPEHFGIRKLGAGARELWESHKKDLEKLTRQGDPPVVLGNFDEMAKADDIYMKQMYAEKIGRGIWVEMTESEVTAIRAQPPIQPSV